MKVINTSDKYQRIIDTVVNELFTKKLSKKVDMRHAWFIVVSNLGLVMDGKDQNFGESLVETEKQKRRILVN